MILNAILAFCTILILNVTQNLLDYSDVSKTNSWLCMITFWLIIIANELNDHRKGRK